MDIALGLAPEMPNLPEKLALPAGNCAIQIKPRLD
jgi:hypothetical protein